VRAATARQLDAAQVAMLVVLALFLGLALTAVISLRGVRDEATLRPLPQVPKELADLPAVSLLSILNRSKLDHLSLESHVHILRQRPLYQRLPDDTLPHPSEGFELRLDWTEAMVYAEAAPTGGYRFIVFCRPERKCYSEIYTGAPRVYRPVAFLRFGAEDAVTARLQLEALHRLIVLEGGQPMADTGKSLSQRLRELPRDPAP
jgi:hypothetical protein